MDIQPVEQTSRGLPVWVIAAIIFGFFSGVFVFASLVIDAPIPPGVVPFSLALFVICVVSCVLYVIWRIRDTRIFSGITLHVDLKPATGGTLFGTISVPPSAPKDIQLSIRCDRLEASELSRATEGGMPPSSVARSMSREQPPAWQQAIEYTDEVESGTRILRFSIDLPGHLPASNWGSGYGVHEIVRWVLMLSAEIPGPDLERTFELPIKEGAAVPQDPMNAPVFDDEDETSPSLVREGARTRLIDVQYRFPGFALMAAAAIVPFIILSPQDLKPLTGFVIAVGLVAVFLFTAGLVLSLRREQWCYDPGKTRLEHLKGYPKLKMKAAYDLRDYSRVGMESRWRDRRSDSDGDSPRKRIYTLQLIPRHPDKMPSLSLIASTDQRKVILTGNRIAEATGLAAADDEFDANHISVVSSHILEWFSRISMAAVVLFILAYMLAPDRTLALVQPLFKLRQELFGIASNKPPEQAPAESSSETVNVDPFAARFSGYDITPLDADDPAYIAAKDFTVTRSEQGLEVNLGEIMLMPGKGSKDVTCFGLAIHVMPAAGGRLIYSGGDQQTVREVDDAGFTISDHSFSVPDPQQACGPGDCSFQLVLLAKNDQGQQLVSTAPAEMMFDPGE